MQQLSKIARPYAKAAFEFAVKSHEVEKWLELLTDAAQLLSENDVVKFIKNPNITDVEVLSLLFGVLKKELNVHQKNFIHLLLLNRRLMVLPEIAKQFMALKASSENSVEAAVAAAFPLTELQTKALIEAIGKRFNAKVQLKCSVDKTILGGAIIHVGDRAFDGSGRHQLKKLNRLLRGAEA